MNLVESLKAVRRSGVPLVAIETQEPAGAELLLLKALNGTADEIPFLKWNLMQGLTPVNKKSEIIASTLNDGQDPALATGRPDEMLRKIVAIPERGIVLMQGSEKVLEDINVRQGIWNLRDQFKANGRTLILFVTVGTKLTPDIKDDIVVLVHDLPNEEELSKKVKSLASDAKVSDVSEDTLKRAVDATLGLSDFAAEQVLAMSLTKNGYNVNDLWDRKRSAIEQTQGLSVWKGKEKFDTVGGCDNVKEFLSKLINGKRRPRVVLFIDEIEKAMSGQQDSSGVNQEMLGTMLTWMQDKGATGVMFMGVAGSGKSAISHCLGNEAGVPTVAFDMSAMKGGIVGQSGANLRAALATVDAIGQGEILVIATCNQIKSLPPELRRRFKLGTFFFDLPTNEERQSIWDIYLAKYGLKSDLPEDNGWTGAEIAQCCDIADRLTVSLKEASSYVVPIAKSAADVIEGLRKGASGNFLSASYKGVYRYEQTATSTPLPTGRRITTD